MKDQDWHDRNKVAPKGNDRTATLYPKTCPACKKDNPPLKVNHNDLARYQFKNELIQDAFPYLTPRERESVMTGFCDDCWTRIFSEEGP